MTRQGGRAGAATTPPLPARATLFVLVVAAHVAAILLLLFARSPPWENAEPRALAIFDVAPPPIPPADPPPPPATPPKPRLRMADPRAPGGSPGRGPVRPADPGPPARFDVTITAEAPPAPLSLAGDLIGTGLDLTPQGGNGRGIGHGTGDGVGDGAGGGGRAAGRLAGADWIYKPERELDYYWPQAKLARRTSATVQLLCRMLKPGKPERCVILSEAPTGLGFGDAAVRVSRHFRIRPVTRDGRTLTNVAIRVPVTFMTPGVPLP